VEGPSHVVFGLAGAVVADSLFHLSGPALLGSPLPADPHTAADALLLKGVFYGFAALGALTPDIDNARSTLGKRMGVVSKEFQHLAGHRTFFHSIIGMLVVGAVIFGLQYALGWGLYDLGYQHAGIALGGGSGPAVDRASVRGVALIALLVGYLLHLIADSLTIGGVPWLWPSKVRFGFPPNRHWRFKSGSKVEPVVVVIVSVAVIACLWFGVLRV
jgi:inner membrane protein